MVAIPLTVEETETFADWLAGLKDDIAQARIVARITGLRHGNPGDAKSVGKGVAEMRINHGPGYRVYYTRIGTVTVLLLCGGDKGSQAGDIATAQKMAAELKGKRR